jgi:hypothetical protein
MRQIMNTQNYVDELFCSYEETSALADFKEELRSNLEDRIKNLQGKDMSYPAAFYKATAELGDISALADEITLKKKQEVFEDMYMGTRKYMTTKRTIIFIIGGAIICFGLISAALAWFSTEVEATALGSALIFCPIGAALLTFMGLTQETSTKYPMLWKRAAFYALSAGLLLFGLLIIPLTWFEATRAAFEGAPAWFIAQSGDPSMKNISVLSAIAVLLPFVLPAIALLVFLGLTEKDRNKPWVVAQRDEMMKRERERFADPVFEKRYGMLCGVVWILAITAFILLTFTVGIKYSWLAVVAGIVGQLLIEFGFAKR